VSKTDNQTKVNTKLSHRCQGGEEVQLLLILDFGTIWG